MPGVLELLLMLTQASTSMCRARMLLEFKNELKFEGMLVRSTFDHALHCCACCQHVHGLYTMVNRRCFSSLMGLHE